jgi:formylglycine-generating enzyme required for sulfatase activity
MPSRASRWPRTRSPSRWRTRHWRGCRRTTASTATYGSDEAALRKAGWFIGNSNQQTQPVGKLAANAWGLFDMHGNVWEWGADGLRQYRPESITDPVGPTSDDSRVLRGGAFDYDMVNCRAAYRGWNSRALRLQINGLRVCASARTELHCSWCRPFLR